MDHLTVGPSFASAILVGFITEDELDFVGLGQGRTRTLAFPNKAPAVVSVLDLAPMVAITCGIGGLWVVLVLASFSIWACFTSLWQRCLTEHFASPICDVWLSGMLVMMLYE